MEVYDRKGTPLRPIVLSLVPGDNATLNEDFEIRELVSNTLCALSSPPKSQLFSIKVSASTIFPFEDWRRQGSPECRAFSDWYLMEFLPRIKARDSRNGTGTYFERMVCFRGLRRKNSIYTERTCNQLDFIIDIWKKAAAKRRRPRQSALQVGCFDPAKDHTGQPVRGFPCLQQVGFGYDDDNGLSVNAFYPTQFIFDRAYGNYLGLFNLGTFMAEQLGLRMNRLNCFIARPELGSIPKGKLNVLADYVRSKLRTEDSVRQDSRSEVTFP